MLNFFLMRGGQKQGPFPLSSLPEMRRYGGLADTDRILVEGAPDWVTIADYLPANQKTTPPPIPASAPPPLPVRSQPTFERTPETVDLSTANDRTIAAIEAGGRFVIYTYCFSVIVMTFRRATKVKLLAHNEHGLGDSVGYSMISLLAGWWGIPWGPIWTIATVYSNLWGGKDVTREVLTERYGKSATEGIMSRRKRPAPAGFLVYCVRVASIVAPLFLAGLLFVPPMMSEDWSKPSVRSPAFDAANQRINVHHGTAAFGNSDQAVNIAAEISTKMLALRETAFEAGDKKSYSISDHQFLVYCDLRQDQCIVMMHVPELRRFDSEAKEMLGELAWRTTQDALRNQKAGLPEMRVLVGLRGVLLYDRVLTGKFSSNADQDFEAVDEVIKNRDQVLKAAFNKK